MRRTARGAGILCLALLMIFAPLASAADGGCALEIRYPCADVTFRLYRVGERSPEGEYALAGEFGSYPLSLENLDAEGFAGAAELLDAYAARDGIEPAASADTGADGTAKFENLAAGLYLVSWQRHTTDGETYTPQPFLVLLPDTITATPKYEKQPAPSAPASPGGGLPLATVSRSVRLFWEGWDYAAYSAMSVTAQLLRNEEVYREVELNESNGWSYEWSGLDASYTWRVVEKDLPDGLTVMAVREGTALLLTVEPPEEVPEPTDVPPIPEPPVLGEDPYPDDAPGTAAPTAPAEPTSSAEPKAQPTAAPSDEQSDEPTAEPLIPRTGQLRWPIPLLALVGLALYLLGWWLSRREAHGR